MGTTPTPTPAGADAPNVFNDSTSRLAMLRPKLSGLSPEVVDQQAREIAQLLRSNGLAYGSIGQRRLTDRPWQLDVSPTLLTDPDWQGLSDGLVQRARIKQKLLADIYGDQQAFTAGILPPQAVFAHKGYLRALRHVPSTWRLPLFNIDVERHPDGHWLAAGASCQVPHNIGFALENRLVMSQVLSDAFGFGQIKRQSPYFRTLLSTLNKSMDIDERCVLLGYGSEHSNHFEHAYLAKYLGYTLVQPNDLTVRDERVWLKTVTGLQRVDVILRFIDDRDTDQLAYAESSAGTGVPGLLHAVINQNVQIINPLGVAALDNPALYAYTEQLCSFYLNEPLLLKNANTYWLGEPSSMDYVLNNLESLTIRNINDNTAATPYHTLDEAAQQALVQSFTLQPQSYVASEIIQHPTNTLSTHQIPAPTIRTYLAHDGETFEAMAGGLCIRDNADTDADNTAISTSQDVWVLSDTPVSHESLLSEAPTAAPDYAIIDGELPSRVAENLFWFSRYAERLEGTLRTLRGVLRTLRRNVKRENLDKATLEVLAVQLRATTIATATLPGFVGAGASRRLQRPEQELLSVLFDTKRTGTLAHTLMRLSSTAESVRDRVSFDLLRVLNRIEDQAQSLQQMQQNKQLLQQPLEINKLIDSLDNLVDSCSAISGMTHESFTHGDGWQFMMLGRRIERARQGNAVLGSVMLNASHGPATLENLLHIFDSAMTYRSRYRSQVDARLVMNLLLLDESNPRSVAYQLLHIERSVRSLPGMRRADHSNPLLKLVAAGLSRLRLVEPGDLLDHQPNQRQSLKKFVMILEEIIAKISTSLSASYFTHTATPTDLNQATLITANLQSNTPDSNKDRP